MGGGKVQEAPGNVSVEVCQEKCVSFIKFPYRQFSKLPVLHAESTLLIFENACLHLIIHGKLITY